MKPPRKPQPYRGRLPESGGLIEQLEVAAFVLGLVGLLIGLLAVFAGNTDLLNAFAIGTFVVLVLK